MVTLLATPALLLNGALETYNIKYQFSYVWLRLALEERNDFLQTTLRERIDTHNKRVVWLLDCRANASAAGI